MTNETQVTTEINKEQVVEALKTPAEKAEYKLPSDAANDLRKILNLKEDESIPSGVIAAYRYYRYTKDVCSAGRVSPSELILLVMLAGYPKS